MPTELEIYRAANQLIQQHGEDAPIECALLADAMLAKGDIEGQRVWKAALKAIDVLRARERREGVALQQAEIGNYVGRRLAISCFY